MSDFWLEKGTSSSFKGNVHEAIVTVQGEFSYFMMTMYSFFITKMGLFGRSKKLQCGTCNYGKPQASPSKAKERKTFIKEKGNWEGLLQKSIRGKLVTGKENLFSWKSGKWYYPPWDSQALAIRQV